MRERYTLSNTEIKYLNDEIALPNVAQTHIRIANKVTKALDSFPTICSSKVISQEFKDKLFPSNKITQFLNRLIRYDPNQSITEEANKQAIALEMATMGLAYFQERYKSNELINEHITKTHNILQILNRQAEEEKEEKEILQMYKTRKKLKRPPFIDTRENFVALCMYCFNFSRGIPMTKHEAIDNLRHEEHCPYHKDTKKLKQSDVEKLNEQYLKIYPPKNKSNIVSKK